MAQPPPQVLDLVQRFDRNRDAYKSPHYNETQLRREFLDPLFKSLGWDMDNEQGYAEAYKDVIHEDAIKVGEATKAPDYCCLGNNDPYLLGLLNSRLAWFAISNISIPFGQRAGKYRYRLFYQYMEKVPIRPINADNAADKSRRDQVASLAEQMLTLHQRHSAARTPQEKTTIERQIAGTDSQLDKLVYDLYGLTDTDIKIVEEATA